MRSLRISVLILLYAANFAVAYKILVYNSRFGHSHSNFMGGIADALADAGDNVTSLIPIMNPNGKDCTTKSKIILIHPDREPEEAVVSADLFSQSALDPISVYQLGSHFGKVFAENCARVLREERLLETLREEKFDVMIAQNFDMCGIGLSYVIQPKALIGGGASFLFGSHYEEFGLPRTPSYNPNTYMSSMNVHSFWSRLLNTCACLIENELFSKAQRRPVERVFREKYGEDFPGFTKLSSNSAYVLTNSEPLIDFATPTISRVIPIPGIGARAAAPLDEKWQEVFNRRSKSILLSLGSNVKSSKLPEDVKHSILAMIARFPDITFIWKYEVLNDEFATKHAAHVENVHLTSWMPQSDLLAHESMALFITHGGMASVQETALRGVPGILLQPFSRIGSSVQDNLLQRIRIAENGVFIPFFGDQPRNAFMMEYNGLGKVLEKTEMRDAEKLTAVVKEVLEDERYASRARHVAVMLAEKPHHSAELLVKHVHFAAKFGPSKALRPQSHDMNFVELHNVDVYASLLLVALILIYLAVTLAINVATKAICIVKAKKD